MEDLQYLDNVLSINSDFKNSGTDKISKKLHNAFFKLMFYGIYNNM